MKNDQMTFEFDLKPVFIVCKGICKCGHKWEFKKSSIAIEMHVPCPGCGEYIRVEKIKNPIF
ncbi:MAG: zinc ribbon-containing protein [bacterium]|nr:zinc ribbon-containing protein [bacterium]